MNADVKAVWTAALRSGMWKQGKGILARVRDGDVEYCCLGVLCELAAQSGIIPKGLESVRPGDGELITYGGHGSWLPDPVRWWAGLGSPNPKLGDACASAWNDKKGATFSEIADLIDEHL